jgi:glycosyltransferase involved in cell wall biosynthesis
MNYFPNADAACWFARECLPGLRRRVPGAGFLAVGRNPSAAVRKLGALPGVRVTGKVADVRPYLRGASAVVAPLRMARGIQNKVLEALAMGRRVFASSAVCDTLAPRLPHGVVRCDAPEEWIGALAAEFARPPEPDPAIRRAARERFSWERNLDPLIEAVESALARPAAAQTA